MRTVLIPGTDIVTSPLGLGCASLGSRISPKQGRRMLDAAFEHGVTWFDVAPSYGAGRAESILAGFLAAHRDRVFVCSKVGLAPPRHDRLIRRIYDFGRPIVGLLQGLRRRFRAVSATRNTRIPLTPDLIETSIAGSLARLGTDRLDVYALHDPDPADLRRDEILAALEKVRARGLARHIGVAGSLVAAEAAAETPLFDVFQLADDPAIRPLPALRHRLDRPAGFVTHSVLGIAGARDRLIRRLADDAPARARLAAAGWSGPPEAVAARLLLRRAFASNRDGVVLASMFSLPHLAENAAIADLPPDPAVLRLLDELHPDRP